MKKVTIILTLIAVLGFGALAIGNGAEQASGEQPVQRLADPGGGGGGGD